MWTPACAPSVRPCRHTAPLGHLVLTVPSPGGPTLVPCSLAPHTHTQTPMYTPGGIYPVVFMYWQRWPSSPLASVGTFRIFSVQYSTTSTLAYDNYGTTGILSISCPGSIPLFCCTTCVPLTWRYRGTTIIYAGCFYFLQQARGEVHIGKLQWINQLQCSQPAPIIWVDSRGCMNSRAIISSDINEK